MNRFLAWILCTIVLSATSVAGNMNDYRKATDAYKQGNYNTALQHYISFTTFPDNQKPPAGKEIIDAYYHLGDIHYFYNDYLGAIKYFDIGYQLSLETGDAAFQEKLLSNICSAYIMMQDYKNARRYFEKIAHIHSTDSIDHQLNVHFLNGYIELLTKNHGRSLPAIRKAIAIAEENQQRLTPYEMNRVYRLMADYYGTQEQWDSTLVYLKKAEHWADRTSNRWAQVGLAQAMMEIYSQMGDAEQSTAYQKKFIALNDSAMNNKRYMEIRTMHEFYEHEAQQKQINGLTHTVEFQRVLIGGVLIIALLTMVFMTIFYVQKRRLSQAYRAVFERNKELIEAEKSMADTQKTVRETPQKPVDDDQELLNRIIEVMQRSDNYCDPAFSLSQLTALVDSNTAYVSKVINNHFGQNVRQFINSYRIKEACRRLLDQENYGHLTLQAIAESVGYDTQTTFNRTFKKLVGITPSIYLRMSVEDKTSAYKNLSN